MTTRNHSVYGLYYHIILTVKYRKRILHRYEDFIKEQIQAAASSRNFEVERMEGDGDHIHILVSAKPRMSPSQIVSLIKQKTTYELWQTHGMELKREFWKEHTFWSPTYFIMSVGSVSKDAVDRYIENQKGAIHPRH
jgi:putative transposase